MGAYTAIDHDLAQTARRDPASATCLESLVPERRRMRTRGA